MPLLSTLGGILSQTYAQWDLGNFFAPMFAASRLNQCGQNFQRTLSSIDYKVQRQMMHREDYRDLMMLAVGRSKIYFLVGTLLLSVAFEWYTGASLLDTSLPQWIVTLFFISGTCAVGFLLFCTWLAMHACVASQAVAIRLRLSFARLTLPEPGDLERLKFPVFPFVQSFFDTARTCAKEAEGAGAEGPETAAAASGGARASSPGDAAPAGGPRFLPKSENAELNDQDDDCELHFRRFAQEQMQWMGYDAYSRVCMSLGLEQLLMAISFSILGLTWTKQPIAGSFTFVGIKILGVMIMTLDLDDAALKGDRLAVYVLYFLPAAATLALMWADDGDDHHDPLHEFITLPIFWLHGAWLVYVVLTLRNSATCDGLLPGRFRLVQFINVLDLQDLGMDEVVSLDEEQTYMADLVAAREGMQAAVAAAKKKKGHAVSALVGQRRDGEMEHLRGVLVAAVEKAQRYVEAGDFSQREEVQRAMEALEEHFAYSRVPEIWEILAALSEEVLDSARAAAAEREAVVDSRLAFLRGLEALRLQVDVPFRASQTGRGDGADPGEEPRAESSAGKPAEEPLPSERLRHWRELCEGTFPRWLSAADGVGRRSYDEAKQPRGQRRSSAAGAAQPGKMSCKTAYVRPRDRLPAESVRAFVYIMVAFWFVSSGYQAYSATQVYSLEVREESRRARLETVAFSVPEPQRLFKVSALSCQEGHVLVGSPFAAYAASWRSLSGVRNLSEVSGGEGAASLLCRGGACDVLIAPQRADAELAWRQQALETQPQGGAKVGADGHALVLPAAWHAVAAAWAPSCAQPPCAAALVAGWARNTTGVVVAEARPDGQGRAWTARPRLEIDLTYGRCQNCTVQQYCDVRDLALSPSGRALAVLLNGGWSLELWGLEAGALLREWRLDQQHTKVCHDGGHLLLSRPGRSGPELWSLALPRGLAL